MTTFLEARRALARALDDLGTYVISGVAGLVITSAALKNTAANASTSRFNESFAYIGEGFAIGSQFTVKQGSYDPLNGTVTAGGAGFDTTPHVNDVMDITRLFPSVPARITAGPTDRVDYRSLLNRAAGRLLTPHLINVTTIAGQQQYNLAAYSAWLDRPERLLAVLDPLRAAGAAPQPTWRRYELRFQGGTPLLTFYDRGYSANGGTFQLSVLIPAVRLINGALSTTGFVFDTDDVDAALEELVAVGLLNAYEALANRDPTGDWRASAKAQFEICRRLASWDRTIEQPPPPVQTGASVATAPAGVV